MNLRHGALISEPGIDAFLRQVYPGQQVSAHLSDPYREDTRIFAAISLIADAAASVPIRIFNGDPKQDEDAQQVPEGDPVAQLFDHVNPMMDSADLRERMTLAMETTGGALWMMTDASGRQVAAPDEDDPAALIPLPEEIWPISQNQAKPKLSPTGMIEKWVVNVGAGRQRHLSPASVMHFSYPNPRGGVEGLAPMDVAIARAEQIKQAMVYQDAILENGGDPGGVLIVKNADDAVMARIAQSVDEQWNDAQAVGDTRIIPADVEYKHNPVTPRDMSYEKLTEVNWQAISEVFRVPPTLLGMRSANFAEHRLHLREFWTIKMLALFRRYEQVLNSRFFPRLREARFQNYRASFDTSMVEALQGDLQEQALAAKELVGIGVPLNQALRMSGVETDPIEGGDVGLVSSTLTPISDVGITDDTDDEPSPPPTPEEESASDPDTSDVVSTAASPGDGGAIAPPPHLDGVAVATSTKAKGMTADARRIYWKTSESRREKSDRRIQARVRAWVKKWRPAQLAHLDKIAGGRKEFATNGAHEPRLMSPVAADLLFDAVKSTGSVEDGFAIWRKTHPMLASRFSPERLYDAALLVKAELSADELDALVVSVVSADFWEDALADELGKAFETAFTEAANAVAAELNADALTLADDLAQDFISSKLIKVKEGVNSTLAKSLQRKLGELFAESPTGSTGSLAEKLRPLLPGAKSAVRKTAEQARRRARTIARTETAQIDSFARNESYKQNGIEKHEWISEGDEFVREDHRALDGEIREVEGGTFSTPNGALRYANDPSGHPAQIINCRCDMAPVIE